MPTILVIDDDSDVSSLMNHLFTLSGNRVEIARNGLDGLARAKHIHPDLVLLDLNIPALNGFDVLDALKANSRTSDIPVIVVSGYTDVRNHEQAYLKGCAACIVKPINLRRLLQLAGDAMTPPAPLA